MIDTYKTIAHPTNPAIYKDKSSKFIAIAYPVDSLEKIKQHLTNLTQEHPKARHICYAYRIGIASQMQYRINDDGEPSGTAGLPIFQQILSKELTNILIVSIRYFGGIKLGVSGLIKAYKTNAQQALEEAIIIEKDILHLINIQFPYTQLASIMAILKKYDTHIIEQNYTDTSCNLRFTVIQKQYEICLQGLEALVGVIF